MRMIPRFRKALYPVSIVCSTVLLALSINAQAQNQTDSPVPELNRLVNNNQHEQAWQLANESLVDWEGDTEFDLLYGLAALESGRPNEATFALERVMNTASQSTTRQRARLELARAHFQTNNLVTAERLFTQVLESDPPQNVQDNIQVFLELIEARQLAQRSNTRFTVSARGGHDNNINSSTSSSLIDTPLIGQVELDPEGLKTADEFIDLSLGMSHQRPFSRNRALEVSANLNQRENLSTDQFDLDSIRASAALSETRGNHRFRGGVQLQKAWLDSRSFQQSGGLNLSWQRAGEAGWYQSVSTGINAIRYNNSSDSPRNDLRDVNQVLLSGGLIHISNQFTNSLNLYYADESALRSAGRHNGREFYGLAHNLVWRINQQHAPFTRVSLQEVKHKDNHPVFFNQTRRDTVLSLTAGWNWDYSRQLQASAEVLYMDSDSNITLFDYSRVRFQAGLRYQFQL